MVKKRTVNLLAVVNEFGTLHKLSFDGVYGWDDAAKDIFGFTSI